MPRPAQTAEGHEALAADLVAAQEAMEAAAAELAARQAARRDAMIALNEAGVSLRAIGAIVGISSKNVWSVMHGQVPLNKRTPAEKAHATKATAR